MCFALAKCFIGSSRSGSFRSDNDQDSMDKVSVKNTINIVKFDV